MRISTPEDILKLLYETFDGSRQQTIGMLHVDAEGFDWKIVHPFLELVTPRIIIFEKNHLTDTVIKNALAFLHIKGYGTWMSGNNIYSVFLGKKLVARL